jgi:hypothetical protein
VIYFHSRRYISLSLFEESSKESIVEGTPVKRGRGRPPKLKAIASSISEINDFTKEEFIPTPVASEMESNQEPVKEVENIVTLSPIEEVSADEVSSELNWESGQNGSFEIDEEGQQFDDNYEEEFIEEDEQNAPETRDFSQNNIALTFSWSLMNQLRQMSKMEGISVEDLLVELVAEGVAKRVFEDQMRPTPSHLMTRTGYVHSDGTQTAPQPHLSHHMMNNNNRQQPNNLQNRNRFSFQNRNPQHQQQNNNNRSPVNNRNYQQNNNNPRQTNNNQNGFRNQYTNNNNNNMQQQRFNSRPNYQNSQRFYEDQSTNSQQSGNQYRQQRDTNKR